MFWFLILIICVILSYWFLIKPYNYWIEKGVKQAKPIPIFGDSYGIISRKQSSIELIEYFYKSNPNTRYSGIYQLFNPVLVLRDPELIKQITVKEFDHFVNHPGFVSDTNDPLWSANLFFLKDKKWREMRSLTSPTFTSSKMRQIFELMQEIGEQFIQYYLKKNDEIITIEMKEAFTRYTNDVIASVAFGIKCDSLEEPNNEFYLMGKDASDFSGFWKNFKFVSYFIFPKLFKFVRISLFSNDVTNFFLNLIKQNIKQRQEHGIVRSDMIQLLLDAHNNSLKYEEDVMDNKNENFAIVEESDITKSTTTVQKKVLSDINITSQAFSFFLAGFDTVSNAMCFMGYELGINPEIQQRLRDEIDKTAKESNNKLTYEALIRMKYMDMVVSETLRKWPNAVGTDRVCTKPYTIEPMTPEEKALHLNIGDSVFIPIYAIHHDPKYYPEPERFDPERFNDENKHKIKPCTYIPFGAGPRSCVGSRFALLEIKALFFYILRHFEIVPIEKTEIPVKISKKSFNTTAENGFWFGLKRRVK